MVLVQACVISFEDVKVYHLGQKIFQEAQDIHQDQLVFLQVFHRLCAKSIFAQINLLVFFLASFEAHDLARVSEVFLVVVPQDIFVVVSVVVSVVASVVASEVVFVVVNSLAACVLVSMVSVRVTSIFLRSAFSNLQNTIFYFPRTISFISRIFLSLSLSINLHYILSHLLHFLNRLSS